MANFGGPDPNMSAQLISVLEKKKDRRLDSIKAMGDGIASGAKLYLGAQEIELRKEEGVRREKELPGIIAGREAATNLDIVREQQARLELNNANEGNIWGATLAKLTGATDAFATKFKSLSAEAAKLTAEEGAEADKRIKPPSKAAGNSLVAYKPGERDPVTGKVATDGRVEMISAVAGLAAQFIPGASRTANTVFNTLYSQGQPYVSRMVEGAKRMSEEAQRPSGWGNRPDGTAKGDGWIGPVKLPDGGVATEYTTQSDAVKVNGKRIDFPTLVPTLSNAELLMMANDIIPNRKPIPEAIMQKAIKHAKGRLASGGSVFVGGQQ